MQLSPAHCGRSAVVLFTASLLLVFVAVPWLTILAGLSADIYGDARVGLVSVWLALVLMPALLLGGRSLEGAVTPSWEPSRTPASDELEWMLMALVLLWTLAFIGAGGLGYRVDDREEGVASRSIGLQWVLGLMGVVKLAVLHLMLRGLWCRLGSRLLLGALVMLVLLASGSRGATLQILLGILLVMWTGGFTHALGVRGLLRQLPIVLILVLALGLVGVLRDAYEISQVYRIPLDEALLRVAGSTEATYFNLLRRLAEPYWYLAVQRMESGDGEPLFDLGADLSRLIYLYIPATVFPGKPEIDGGTEKAFLLLGAERLEGISLPITVFGDLVGSTGLTVALLALALLPWLMGPLAVAFARVLNRSSFAPAGMAYVLVAILNLYPKSITGVVQVFAYELPRDLLLFWCLTRLLVGLQGRSQRVAT